MEQPQEVDIKRALYIKLGKGGEWERSCLTEQTLRLDYREVPHEHCAAHDWVAVRQDIEVAYSSKPGVVTAHLTQIKLFYEADETTLWVTFYADQLWWCFSRRDIRLLPDGTKERPVVGKWRSTDTHGMALTTNRLSGKLTAVQGFQGTVCRVSETGYLRNKINGREQPLVAEARGALAALQDKLEHVVRHLNWYDFETLIDLIFQRAGWQRLAMTGGTRKGLDIDLISPVSEERVAVQVKSRAGLAEFDAYREGCADMAGRTAYYFVVHSPGPDLAHAETGDTFRLWLPQDVSRLAVQYGLSEWVIDKVR
ncbi:MAG TPA: restriction endonuclease [Chloroflexota bacterium]|nr:restriction endonuclease [Chloroflexota bacterium]